MTTIGETISRVTTENGNLVLIGDKNRHIFEACSECCNRSELIFENPECLTSKYVSHYQVNEKVQILDMDKYHIKVDFFNGDEKIYSIILQYETRDYYSAWLGYYTKPNI